MERWRGVEGCVCHLQSTEPYGKGHWGFLGYQRKKRYGVIDAFYIKYSDIVSLHLFSIQLVELAFRAM